MKASSKVILTTTNQPEGNISPGQEGRLRFGEIHKILGNPAESVSSPSPTGQPSDVKRLVVNASKIARTH
jgi:hypothetical protein